MYFWILNKSYWSFKIDIYNFIYNSLSLRLLLSSIYLEKSFGSFFNKVFIDYIIKQVISYLFNHIEYFSLNKLLVVDYIIYI